MAQGLPQTPRSSKIVCLMRRLRMDTKVRLWHLHQRRENLVVRSGTTVAHSQFRLTGARPRHVQEQSAEHVHATDQKSCVRNSAHVMFCPALVFPGDRLVFLSLGPPAVVLSDLFFCLCSLSLPSLPPDGMDQQVAVREEK